MTLWGQYVKFGETLHIPWYVVLMALMVTVICILRMVSFVVEGHDDPVLTQVLTGFIALFTGSFAVARAGSNGKGNGKGE